MSLLITLLFAIPVAIYLWFLYLQIGAITKLLREIHKVVNDDPKKFESPVVPNQINEEDPNIIELNENNPLNLPNDIKIEVEGGDTLSPFEITSTNSK